MNENLLSEHAVKAEIQQFEKKDSDRKKFLKKIAMLNDNIIERQSTGKMVPNKSIMDKVIIQNQANKEKMEKEMIDEFVKVEATRREFERKLMAHKNFSHIQKQAEERRRNEEQERQRELISETDQLKYRMQNQAKDEIERSKKKMEKNKSYKKDLEDIIQENAARKIQNHVGITKEEMALNKGLLSSMLVQQKSRESPTDVRGNKSHGVSRVDIGFQEDKLKSLDVKLRVSNIFPTGKKERII